MNIALTLMGVLWANGLLTQLKQVRDLVIEQTPKAMEIRQKIPSFQEAWAQFDGQFEWRSRLEAGYDRNRLPPFAPVAFILGQDFTNLQAQLTRPFLSGTVLQVQFQYLQSQFLTNNLFPIANQLFSYSTAITITQSLWRNAFGQAWRRQRQSLSYREKAVLYGAQEELEGYLNELFKLMAPFWVADRQIEQLRQHVKRLEQLLEFVNRRATWGYVLIGEKESIIAELISARAQLDQFLSQKKALEQGLNSTHPKLATYIPRYEDLVELSRIYRPWRACAQFDEKRNRLFLAQQNQLKAQQENWQVVKSQSHPDLQAVLTYQWAGINPREPEAWDQYALWLRSRSFVGLQLSWEWGSDARNRILQAQNSQVMEQEYRLLSLQQELRRRFENMQTTGFNWELQWDQSQAVIKTRELARQKMLEAFKKGRVDFGLVLEAYTKEYLAHLREIQLIVDYLLWLGDWWNLVDTWLDPDFRVCQI